ncbi:DnaJ subfamily C member 5 isoform 1 [Schistosoma japonicum]|uniref:DnaJ subfamily C member 5 isoform 1 n=1 Tax=Schistosoma japonicum TaxID=6182 RepID=A0A4Z2DR36_SCHJA|nr:DnaJ subfamily C member 5 isoform 1 [Schistosoma japonicum]
MPPDSSRGDNSKNKGGQKSSKENINLYAILEVDRNATAEEIRKSYRRLALKYHPDKNVKDPGASEKFKEINRAHSILANEQKRKLYDRYGSLGIYVAEHIDEEDWKPYLALRNPCVQVDVIAYTMQYFVEKPLLMIVRRIVNFKDFLH